MLRKACKEDGLLGKSVLMKQIDLPAAAEEILRTIWQAGYEAYIVGGCVRDACMGRVPSDWDITTSAGPEEVKKLFRRTLDTGIKHGTVTVMVGSEGFEVTTYRIDGEYLDGRHPKEVTFTASLEEDLKRRDFTINAMAYNSERGLVDLFGGQEDLEKKVIRCVGDPKERFSEDALRMMRAARFAAQLGFSIDESTKEAMKELAPTLKKVSAERIQAELVKLLTSDHPNEFKTLYETGLTAVFLPEFDACMNTPQNSPHHAYNVGDHTLKAMEGVRADKVLRLAMLLHDMGKAVTRTTDENGRDHFRGHARVSEEMAKKILHRLKFDNATTTAVCRMVKYHDWQIHSAETEYYLRLALHQIGKDAFPDIFEVNRADVMAQSDLWRNEKLSRIDRLEELYHSVLDQGQCVTKEELALSGKELIELGVKPGPAMGKILDRMLESVLEDPARNTREYLTSHLESFLS